MWGSSSNTSWIPGNFYAPIYEFLQQLKTSLFDVKENSNADWFPGNVTADPPPTVVFINTMNPNNTASRLRGFLYFVFIIYYLFAGLFIILVAGCCGNRENRDYLKSYHVVMWLL